MFCLQLSIYLFSNLLSVTCCYDNLEDDIPEPSADKIVFCFFKIVHHVVAVEDVPFFNVLQGFIIWGNNQLTLNRHQHKSVLSYKSYSSLIIQKQIWESRHHATIGRAHFWTTLWQSSWLFGMENTSGLCIFLSLAVNQPLLVIFILSLVILTVIIV